MGILPEGMFNYLALLGFSPGGDVEVMTPEELCQSFDLKRVGASAAIFDLKKLLWLNGVHLRRLAGEEFTERALRWLKEYDPATLEKLSESRMRHVLPLYHDGITHFGELTEKLKVFSDPEIHLSPDGEEILSLPTFPDALNLVKERMSDLPEEGEARAVWLEEVMQSLKERSSAKGKALYQPLRLILTGEPHGPDLKKIFLWIPEAILKARIEAWTRSIR
jgi:nondiscriminating glutamyl-tRNA synthetase